MLKVARWSTDCSGWFLGWFFLYWDNLKETTPKYILTYQYFWISILFGSPWEFSTILSATKCTCYCLIWCNITCFDCYDIGRELTSPLPQKFLKNESCIKCRFNLQIKTDTKLHNCGELSDSSRLFTASASSVSRMFFFN